MNNRRQFLASLASLSVFALPRLAFSSPQEGNSESFVTPPRRPEPRIPGVNYFNARKADARLPDGHAIYLDGVDMTARAFEADLREGWINAFTVRPDKWTQPGQTCPTSMYFGKIEVLPHGTPPSAVPNKSGWRESGPQDKQEQSAALKQINQQLEQISNLLRSP